MGGLIGHLLGICCGLYQICSTTLSPGVLPTTIGREGRAAGLQEGRELGLQKGFEIAQEVGFYAGECLVIV